MVNVELLENSGDHGGAIYNEGSLKMYATTAKFCSSKFCGGVLYHATGGRADASGCTFEANTELGCVREKAERDASELPAQLEDGAAPTVSLQNTAFGEKLPPGYYDDYELLEAQGSDGKIRDASTGRVVASRSFDVSGGGDAGALRTTEDEMAAEGPPTLVGTIKEGYQGVYKGQKLVPAILYESSGLWEGKPFTLCSAGGGTAWCEG